MVVNVTLDQTQATAGTVPAFPAYIGPDNQATTATSKVSAVAQAAGPLPRVYTKFTHEYVNSAGVVQTVGAPAQNFVRYAEYPGQRLFRKVKFDVNGNPLTHPGGKSIHVGFICISQRKIIAKSVLRKSVC
jgi:hypothetical protein